MKKYIVTLIKEERERLNLLASRGKNRSQRIINALNEINMVYYRPSEYFPVLRVEIAPSIALNNHRLAMLFESIKLTAQSLLVVPEF